MIRQRSCRFPHSWRTGRLHEPEPIPQRPPAPWRTIGAARLALLPLGLAAVVCYPLIAEAAITRFGVRTSAVALLAIACTSALAARARLDLRSELYAQLIGLGLLFGAVWTRDREYLLLLPAAIYLLLFDACRSSLAGSSLIEQGARLLDPLMPDFVRPYCRNVTALWAGFFLANAAVIGALAVLAPIEIWRAYTTWVVYVFATTLISAEFVFRKLWFRHYGRSPLDRVLARLVPAENTERGRRSQAHIAGMRAMLRRQQGGAAR